MFKMIGLFLCLVTSPAFSNTNHTFALTDLDLADLEISINKNDKSKSLKKIEALNAGLNEDHDFHTRSSDHRIMVDYTMSELKKISEFIKSDKKNDALTRLKAMRDWLKGKIVETKVKK